MRKNYLRQVKLLVEAIPYIEKEECFALKGGTAINLFLRDMPRLSVDIDLTYLNFDDRASAMKNQKAALERILRDLIGAGFYGAIQGSGEEKKIIVSDREFSIKIEPNCTLRGHIFKPKLFGICKKAEQEFGYAEMRIVSAPELFGGKMCAALDRQHPRDLFDISLLLEDDTMIEGLIDGFIVMLLSHNRPLHEILNPMRKDMSRVFDQEFSGMTDIVFTYDQHVSTLEKLLSFIYSKLVPYRNLLLDFVSLRLDLATISIPNIDKLPAILWKQQNLTRLRERDYKKFCEQEKKLEQVLNAM